jgi:asparagine synthase (glutamine-hydrolysing)
MFRYMAFMWNPGSAQVFAEVDHFETCLRAGADGWRVALDKSGTRVMVAECSRYLNAHRLSEDLGVVLGGIFARIADVEDDTPADVAKFNDHESWEVLRTQGRSLISRFWGNYVAIVVDAERGARHVLNDPVGTLPCYFTRHRGVTILFSALSDCRLLGVELKVNWDYVRSRAVNSLMDLDKPSLVGISTVHRGECVKFDEKGAFVSRSMYWHPSNFERADELIVDPTSAAKAMRGTVRSCLYSVAAQHSSILTQTSGGLDSSVVLGVLSAAPHKPRITCYTDYIPDSPSDERRWARYATKRVGHRHIEVCRDPREIVFREMAVLAPSVEPASYFTSWLKGPKERQLAAEFDATLVLSGDGGDSTFCSTSFVYSVDHSLKRYGLGLRTLRLAMSVAKRRDRTVWRVLGKSLRRVLIGEDRGDERRRLAVLSSMVTADAKAAVQREEGCRGPSYLEAGGRVTQEMLLRMGTLAFPPTFYDLSTSAAESAPYTVSILSAQPVFEACARIPVDVHFDGGRIRGLARRAFTDVLPVPILRRQWKDRPLLFVPDVIARNRDYLRETLLDGALVRERILQRKALDLALRGGPTRSGALGAEIVSHLDLELWIRDSH